MKKFLPLFILPTSFAVATCDSQGPANCNQETCTNSYCTGPAQLIANAPVRPYTCDGDIELTAGVLYWQVQEDGLEYGAKNSVGNSNFLNPIDEEYLSPQVKHSFGYRFGLGYSSPCDGWNIGLLLTHLNNRTSKTDGSAPQVDIAEIIIPFWSALAPGSDGSPVHLSATRVSSNWSTGINLVDLILGREYWISKQASLRPFTGLRGGSLRQTLALSYQGGLIQFGSDLPANNEVSLKNYYEGIGVVGGLELDFNFGCGWSLFGEFAGSILYGQFSISHDENIREMTSPFSKVTVLETKNTFKSSKPAVDLSLGIQWHSLVSDNKYGFTALLAWEQHIFFNQNQLWRVQRDLSLIFLPPSFPNNIGENIHYQRRGSLSTSGLTLTFKFDF